MKGFFVIGVGITTIVLGLAFVGCAPSTTQESQLAAISCYDMELECIRTQDCTIWSNGYEHCVGSTWYERCYNACKNEPAYRDVCSGYCYEVQPGIPVLPQ